MAKRALFPKEELRKWADSDLKPPGYPPSGNEAELIELDPACFSRRLEKELLSLLEKHPAWNDAGALATGSLARGELCASSDVDLWFVGDTHAASEIVRDLSLGWKWQSQGLPSLHAVSVPNVAQWKAEVPLIEQSKLIDLRPLSRQAEEWIKGQFLTSDIHVEKSSRRPLLRAIRDERQARIGRSDPLGTKLEPHLKLCPGGLRDVQQARWARALAPHRFVSKDHSSAVFDYYARFFLLIRHWLHVYGSGGDRLSAWDQAELCRWLGYPNEKEGLREIQKGFGRIAFYTDVILTRSLVPQKSLDQVGKRPLLVPKDFFNALQESPEPLMQERVRIGAPAVFAGSPVPPEGILKYFEDYCLNARSRQAIEALFHSRLIDFVIPEFRNLVGLTSHDQYHLYTADTHILRCVCVWFELFEKPRRWTKWASSLRQLSQQDRRVLLWTCLFHDIAKGQGGDHDEKGRVVAEAYLQSLKDPELTSTVTWLVKHHLSLSIAAFRRNSSDPNLIRELIAAGIVGHRSLLLGVFTAMDIRGTNPEAWTSWKDDLLRTLVRTLEHPQTIATAKLYRIAPPGFEDIVAALDPFLIGAVQEKKLLSDIRKVLQAKDALFTATLVAGRNKRLWIRFHYPVDMPGLFVRCVFTLKHVGASIRHASILSHPRLGVYNWFEVKPPRSSLTMNQRLTQVLKVYEVDDLSAMELVPPNMGPLTAELVAITASEWIIAIRGEDHPGALLRSALAIKNSGASVHWAKVHTWGKGVDDVFGLEPLASCSVETFIEELNRVLCQKNGAI